MLTFVGECLRIDMHDYNTYEEKIGVGTLFLLVTCRATAAYSNPRLMGLDH